MCFRACMYLCFSQASAMLIWAGENNVPSIWKCENSAATSFAGRGQQQLYPTFTFLSERKGFCKYRHAQMQINALSLSLSLSHTHTHRCSQCAKVDRRRRRIRINMSRSRLSCAPRYQSASPKLELKYTSGWASLFKTLLRSSACLVSATLLQT